MAPWSSPALGCSNSCNALDSVAFNSDGMSRVIKFRAWDTSDAEHPHMLGPYDFTDSIFNYKGVRELPLMQFTGLHDKNGEEIFEGDFFQRPVKINKSLHGEWTIYQFMIKNGNTIISYLRSEKDTGIPEGYMAALYTDELDIDMKTLMFAKEVTLHEVQILGNIHEHKHLLK